MDFPVPGNWDHIKAWKWKVGKEHIMPLVVNSFGHFVQAKWMYQSFWLEIIKKTVGLISIYKHKFAGVYLLLAAILLYLAVIPSLFTMASKFCFYDKKFGLIFLHIFLRKTYFEFVVLRGKFTSLAHKIMAKGNNSEWK